MIGNADDIWTLLEKVEFPVVRDANTSASLDLLFRSIMRRDALAFASALNDLLDDVANLDGMLAGIATKHGEEGGEGEEA